MLRAYLYAVRKWHNKITTQYYEDKKLSEMRYDNDWVWPHLSKMPSQTIKGTSQTTEDFKITKIGFKEIEEERKARKQL